MAFLTDQSWRVLKSRYTGAGALICLWRRLQFLLLHAENTTRLFQMGIIDYSTKGVQEAGVRCTRLFLICLYFRITSSYLLLLSLLIYF